MTPQEAAIDLIRAYVERGDDPKWIRDGQMGSYNERYAAQIGGYLIPGQKRYGTDKILVKRVNGEEVNQVFNFSEIYTAIKGGMRQQSLF